MPERALTSFTICDSYRYFDVSLKVEYLIPTDNVILD